MSHVTLHLAGSTNSSTWSQVTPLAEQFKMVQYTALYDPLYYPECYPEVFATPSSVKMWLETSLCSHISLCCLCSSTHQLLGVKFSVQWRDPYYLVCAYADGKLKQCVVSLEDLQSKTYVHCQIVSRLCRASLVVPLSDPCINVYSVIAQEEPAWIFHSEDLYHLHLSQLPAPVLASAAKSCSTSRDFQNIPHNKTSFISIIIDHFVSECGVFLAAVRDGTVFSQDKMCAFVEHTEWLYGSSIAALLCELPFLLSPRLMHRPSVPEGLQWFHESIDELVHRLHTSFSTDALLCELKKIPGHRQPVYDSVSRHKTSDYLVVHVLCHVLHLFDIRMGPLSEIVLSLCPTLKFEHEPTQERLIRIIVENEYGSPIFKSLSKPVLSKKERARISRREEKISRVQTAKGALESYEATWPLQVPQAHIFECLNSYREGTVWTDPLICAVCGQGSQNAKEVCFGEKKNAASHLRFCMYLIVSLSRTAS